MNRNIIYQWLPAAVILICVVILVLRFVSKDDNGLVATPGDQIETPEVKPEKMSKGMDAINEAAQLQNQESALSTNNAGEGETGSGAADTREAWDKQQWESSGGTLTERLQNYAQTHPKTEPMDKEVKPIYATNRELNIDKVNEQLQALKEQGDAGENEALWAVLQFEPEMNGTEVTGLRLADTTVSDILLKKGLEAGDVIKQVNGSVLDNEMAAFEGMNTIGESQHLELVVERSGKTMNVVIDK